MNHRELFNYLKSKDKTIDIDGNITDLKIKTVFISIYIIICILYFIDYIKELTQIPYYPITLYSTNLYSKFAEQILILNKINYQKIYHPVLVNPAYYLNSKRKTVTFNPNLSDFNNNVEVPFIPLSAHELEELSEHTTIDKDLLIQSQKVILEELPNINSYHVVRENYLYDDDYYCNKNQVKYIKKINNKYLVVCHDKSFYTSIILTDYTFLLQPGEIISTAYTIDNSDIQFENKYIVDDEYRLESLKKKMKKNINILPCYSLSEPRKSLILHPFHLTKSKDFILSIMIIVQSIIMMF
jgi:hypothetical protein